MQQALSLPAEALEVSWRSLREVGNLSSTSVLLVLEEVMRDPAAGAGRATACCWRWARASARSWCCCGGRSARMPAALESRRQARPVHALRRGGRACERMVELDRVVAATCGARSRAAASRPAPATTLRWSRSTPPSSRRRVLEVWLLRRPWIPSLGVAMLGIVAAAMALRYWVIATLGERWTTRVVVRSRRPARRRGPFRCLRHPNYAGGGRRDRGDAARAHAPGSPRWSSAGQRVASPPAHPVEEELLRRVARRHEAGEH